MCGVYCIPVIITVHIICATFHCEVAVVGGDDDDGGSGGTDSGVVVRTRVRTSSVLLLVVKPSEDGPIAYHSKM